MRKLGTTAVCLMLGVAIGLATHVPQAQAKKVDCAAVMQELNSGKKPKEVAKDLKISVSSVRRCRRKTKQAAKAAPEASPAASPAAH